MILKYERIMNCFAQGICINKKKKEYMLGIKGGIKNSGDNL